MPCRLVEVHPSIEHYLFLKESADHQQMFIFSDSSPLKGK